MITVEHRQMAHEFSVESAEIKAGRATFTQQTKEKMNVIIDVFRKQIPKEQIQSFGWGHSGMSVLKDKTCFSIHVVGENEKNLVIQTLLQKNLIVQDNVGYHFEGIYLDFSLVRGVARPCI